MATKKLIEVWDGSQLIEKNIIFLKQKTKEYSYQDKLVILEPSYEIKTYFALVKNNAETEKLNKLFSEELIKFKKLMHISYY